MAAIGLLLLVGASVLAGAGIGANRGDPGSAPVSFDIFGYYPADSSNQLFAGGIALGAIAMLGLALIVVGLRRRAQVSTAVRRERRQSRRERRSLSKERDNLAAELEATRTDAAPVAEGATTARTGWLSRRRRDDAQVGANSV
jgi:hypothetical protein